MKKYLLSSLLLIMISLICAKSQFLDMRTGDFGCITRVVFEFTGKIDYSIKEGDNNFSISLNSLQKEMIQLPIEQSNNITSIGISDEAGSAKIKITFSYPLQVTSYNYFQENKNYVIVLDAYDMDYQTDKEKALATLLFKAQKFPLSKSSSDIANFSQKYPTDSLVNFYLGRLYASKKMSTVAIEYFNRIETTSEYYLQAQAYINNIRNKKFPLEEVKPDFLQIIKVINNNISDSLSAVEAESIAALESDSLAVVKAASFYQKRLRGERTAEDIPESEDLSQTKEINQETANSSKYWFIYLTLSLLIIIFQIIQNAKKRYVIKELSAKVESANFELKALENKLAKGVVENSKTKEKIIIKLFNSGWKPADIANELNTSIEDIEATISKEGRL